MGSLLTSQQRFQNGAFVEVDGDYNKRYGVEYKSRKNNKSSVSLADWVKLSSNLFLL